MIKPWSQTCLDSMPPKSTTIISGSCKFVVTVHTTIDSDETNVFSTSTFLHEAIVLQEGLPV